MKRARIAFTYLFVLAVTGSALGWGVATMFRNPGDGPVSAALPKFISENIFGESWQGQNGC